MKYFLLVLGVLSTMIFFSIMAFLGIDYEGAEASNSLKIFTAITAAITIFIVVKDESVKRSPIRNRTMYVVPIVVYLFSYLLVTAFNGYFESVTRNMLIFFSYSVPAIFVGTYLANYDAFVKTRKWFDLAVLTLSFALILSLPRMIASSTFGFAGGTYQALSYMAAFSFSFNYHELFRENEQTSFLPQKVIKPVRIVLIGFLLLITFIGGGRGAAVLVILSVIFFLKLSGRSLIKTISSIFVIGVLSYWLLNTFSGELADRLSFGFERAFSYLSVDHIDLTQTSGRDVIYSEAIDSINKSPIFGYGLLGYLVPQNFKYAYSPHNIFLEVLLQGGYVYLLLFLSFFVYLGRKLYLILKNDPRQTFIIPLFLYPIVNLLFSGDYLLSPLFWFCICYTYTYKIKRTK